MFFSFTDHLIWNGFWSYARVVSRETAGERGQLSAGSLVTGNTPHCFGIVYHACEYILVDSITIGAQSCLNLQSLEVVSRYRDPQLQVTENYNL